MKDNVYGRDRIYRLAIAHSRLESDLLRCAARCFLESITEPSQCVQDSNLAVGAESDAKQDFAFNSLLTGLGGIVGSGLECDLDRGFRDGSLLTSLLSRRGWLRIAEAALANCSSLTPNVQRCQSATGCPAGPWARPEIL